MPSSTELPEDFDHHELAHHDPGLNGPDNVEGAADVDNHFGSVDESDGSSGDGISAHYVGGRLHRTDGPALVMPDGTEKWFFEGRLHRSDGGPAVATGDGSLYWYRDGRLHRTCGPAVIKSDGTRAWYRNGRLHRTDGPAIRGPFTSARWYVDGRRMSAHGAKFARARRDTLATPAWSPRPEPTLEYDPAPDFDLESE